MSARQSSPGPVADRLAALLAQQLTARRDCRWQAWANGRPAFCRRAACGLVACQEPPRRHLAQCRYGRWDTALAPVGAPCSPRCQAIADTLAEHARHPGLFT